MISRFVSLDRRALLKIGLLAGAAASFSRWATAADIARLPVISKRIPSTGESLPAIGLGTNRFRMTGYDGLRAVLRRSHELGGSVIDTAAIYGDSETVIGTALAADHIRERMFIATKFEAAGVDIGAPPGAPVDTMFGEESFERSLSRLQTDYVDLMQAHHLASADALMPLLAKLKRSGKIRYIGITTIENGEHPQLIEYMQKYPVDFVQVDYSFGNREAAETVFPIARRRRIAIVAAEPLGGRYAPGANSLMDQIGNRRLPEWAADIDVTSWSQFFLKYVISHPDVTCAIPGATQLNHLEDNELAGHGRIADEAMRKRMESYWDHVS